VAIIKVYCPALAATLTADAPATAKEEIVKTAVDSQVTDNLVAGKEAMANSVAGRMALKAVAACSPVAAAPPVTPVILALRAVGAVAEVVVAVADSVVPAASMAVTSPAKVATISVRPMSLAKST
jgi:hypothetical protein